MNWFLFQRISDDHWHPVWGWRLTQFWGGALVYLLYLLPPAALIWKSISKMRGGHGEYRRLLWWALWFLAMMMVSNAAHLLPRHSFAWLAIFTATATAGVGWIVYGARLPIWHKQSRR